VTQLKASYLTMKHGGHNGNGGNLIDKTTLIYTY